MPTALPRSRRVEAKQSAASIIFNTFLVVSALLLAFLVVVREESYAFPQPETAIGEQVPRATPIDMTGGSMALPPD